MDGDAVGRLARRELVGEVELEPTLTPGRRVRARRNLARCPARQQVLGEGQQVGPLAAFALPPPVEVPHRDDVRRDPLVVEGEEHLVVDDDVASASTLLELPDPLEHRLVLAPEGVVGVPVALDESTADEDLAGPRRVDPAVLHSPVHDEGDPVQGDPLGGDRRPLAPRPARLAVGALDDVGADLLGPPRVDPGVDPRPEPGCLDELGGHDVVGLATEQRRPGRDGEAGPAGAGILTADLVADADV